MAATVSNWKAGLASTVAAVVVVVVVKQRQQLIRFINRGFVSFCPDLSHVRNFVGPKAKKNNWLKHL